MISRSNEHGSEYDNEAICIRLTWEGTHVLVVLTGIGPNGFKKLQRREMTFRLLHHAASLQGLEMLLTTPDRVDVTHGSIQGWRVSKRDGSWESHPCALSSSNVIYDAMYLTDLNKARRSYRKLMSQLKQTDIALFNPKLPPKDELYALLGKREPGLQRRPVNQQVGSRRLIPQTYLHVNQSNIMKLLQEAEGPLWCKPVYGSGGRNMLCISPLGQGRYLVQGERFYERSIFAKWNEPKLLRQIQRAMGKRRYIVQENVPLIETNDHRKVDFRVTLCRGKQGNWNLIALTARLGKPWSSLTNFHAGGSILSLTEGDSERELNDYQLLLTPGKLEEIRNVAFEAATCISDQFPAVGILGVDVGVSSSSGTAYVYDCNSRPGRDILTDREVEHMMNQIAGFASYIEGQK